MRIFLYLVPAGQLVDESFVATGREHLAEIDPVKL